MEDADFSGYATKTGLKCSDGRIIMKDAFKHQDKMTVPLVWSHSHSDPDNVLGHAVLENREDGVYCWGYFNDTPKGISTKKLVQHGDVTWLSIYANQLVERAKQVFHGAIREVSLVLAGANPEAKIDYVALQHGDDVFGDTEPEDEAVIHTGIPIDLPSAKQDDEEIVHADDNDDSDEGDDGETVQDVYDAFSDKQKQVVHFMIGAALDANATSSDSDVQHSDDGGSESDADSASDDDESDDDESASDESDDSQTSDETQDEDDLAHQEGSTDMTRNVFDQTGSAGVDTSHRLSHDDLVSIVKAGKQSGSFKEAVLAHAEQYGITDINLLFPDAKALTETPEFISRRMEWVATVLNGTKHSPFAKVKTLLADITEPEARAKGYIKGTRKKEEVFKLLRRTTGPATIYKKQKLDRDDLLDITDINVVNWLKAEMRLMIEEELARAILVGDGRSAMDDDKVKDPEGALDGTGIRSILHDDDLYAIKVPMESNVSPKDSVKAIVRAMDQYRGSGAPTMFIGRASLTDMLLEEDRFERPLYANKAALADKLGVGQIVPVDIFSEYEGLFAIIVSLQDYTIGSNRGGELTSFEDFDIDFNQNKYLQETRLSGGLTKPFSAIVVTRAVGTLATASAPSFDGTTDTITIPTDEGVVYSIDGVDQADGAEVGPITEPTTVSASAEDGYYLGSGTTRDWTYTP